MKALLCIQALAFGYVFVHRPNRIHDGQRRNEEEEEDDDDDADANAETQLGGDTPADDAETQLDAPPPAAADAETQLDAVAEEEEE